MNAKLVLAATVAGIALVFAVPLLGQTPRKVGTATAVPLQANNATAVPLEPNPRDFHTVAAVINADAPKARGWEYRVVAVDFRPEATRNGTLKEIAAKATEPMSELTTEGGWEYVEKLSEREHILFLLFKRAKK
jgi:hypothetical protein